MKGLPADQTAFSGNREALKLLDKALVDNQPDTWKSFIEYLYYNKLRTKNRYNNSISACDLSGINLESVSLHNFHFVSTSFVRANLRHAQFGKAPLARSDFSGTQLVGANFLESRLDNCLFEGTEASEATFTKCNLHSATFSDATSHDSRFIECNLKLANFRKASLCGSDFTGSNLEHADLRYADFSGADFSTALMSEVDMREGIFDRACFRRTSLTGSDLRLGRFILCDFTEAVMDGVKLWSAITRKWCVGGVQCRYAFIDEHGEHRSPHDRDFAPLEFEKVFGYYPLIDVFFTKGIEIVDVALVAEAIEIINRRDPDLNLRLTTISNDDIAPKMRFRVAREDDLGEVRRQIEREYQQQIEHLKVELAGLQGEKRVLERMSARLLEGLRPHIFEQTIYQLAPGGNVVQGNSVSLIQNQFDSAIRELDAAQLEPPKRERLKEILADVRKGVGTEVGKSLVTEAKELMKDAVKGMPLVVEFLKSVIGTFV